MIRDAIFAPTGSNGGIYVFLRLTLGMLTKGCMGVIVGRHEEVWNQWLRFARKTY